jgi:hypothetical protein
MNFDSSLKSPNTEATDIVMNIPITHHQLKNGKDENYFKNQYLVVLSERIIKGMTRMYCAKLLNLKCSQRIVQIEYKLKRILSNKMKGYNVKK